MEKKQMRRALLYDPYLDTLGGGERYFLTLALALKNLGFSVDIAWDSQKDLIEAERRFGLDTSLLTVNLEAFNYCASRSSIRDRIKYTSPYDLIFWVSDGSLPFLFGKNNLVHFQVPFTHLGGNPLANRLKLLSINKLVYNSKFTRSVIERSLPSGKGFVLYPPIDTTAFKPGKKEKLILSVARFDSPSHSKRQDVLIGAFKIFSSKIKDYRLVLVGGQKGDSSILDNLKKLSSGLSVDIIPNPDFDSLKKLYSKAEFFWHSAGYGIDEVKDPEKVEHFGMTTVEAMSAGCIPIAISKGGQKEIITTNSGFLVNTPDEIASVTIKLIRKNQLTQYSKAATFRSDNFSTREFINKIKLLIS